MKTDISKLVRSNIANLQPYSSARDEYSGSSALLLDANENPYNSPYNRYPDPHQTDLKKKIGKIKGIDASNIFIGNGSDEAIDLLYRIFCEPGKDNVVSISPSYGMFKVCADINQVEMRTVPLNNDFSLDTQGLKEAVDAHTKMLFLCSPNNPTSNSFSPEEILSLVSDLNLIVVLDEAYIDFSQRKSLKEEISNHNNIVVLQTFSKAWGLAGIRLGIALADQEIISLMTKVKYPYNMNMLTLNFALEALNNEAEKNEWISVILSEREELERKLKMYRFVEKVYPSDANFLLVKVRKPIKVYTFLVEKKIIVRDRSSVELCEGCLRITVGSKDDNYLLTEALMHYQRDFVEPCDL
ncbi:histidinol-phosphate transaminase [Bacteroidota bacterium]